MNNSHTEVISRGEAVDAAYRFRVRNIIADLRGSRKGGSVGDNTYEVAKCLPTSNQSVDAAPKMRNLKEYRVLHTLRVHTRSAIILQKYVRRMLVLNSIESIRPIDVSVTETRHAVGWNQKNHYGEMGWCWCGQSCPCCRAKAGDILGACSICSEKRS